MRVVVLAGIALCLVSCGSEGTDLGAPGVAALLPTYSSILANVFRAKCLSCHGGSRKEAGLDLGTYGTLMGAASTHGHAVVVPGQPDASHLLERVAAGEMPPNGPALSRDEVAAIRDWIAQGALEN